MVFDKTMNVVYERLSIDVSRFVVRAETSLDSSSLTNSKLRSPLKKLVYQAMNIKNN